MKIHEMIIFTAFYFLTSVAIVRQETGPKLTGILISINIVPFASISFIIFTLRIDLLKKKSGVYCCPSSSGNGQQTRTMYNYREAGYKMKTKHQTDRNRLQSYCSYI